MKYDVWVDTKLALEDATLAKVAKFTGLAKDEIAKFVEEEGRCDTETAIVVPAGSDEPGPLEEAKAGSVISEIYKARYKAAGNPRGCDDWLHRFLDEHARGKDGKLDLPTFEALCAENAVSLEKYNRTNPGWQGRLRMTGRILLRSAILRDAEHRLLVPGGDPVPAPRDWIAANSKGL